ncbi:hypothetical protein GCM10010174_07220 [Kutzneria viridogrisea]
MPSDTDPHDFPVGQRLGWRSIADTEPPPFEREPGGEHGAAVGVDVGIGRVSRYRQLEPHACHAPDASE